MFGRPTSKISHKSNIAEENQFIERFQPADPEPESRHGQRHGQRRGGSQSGGQTYSEEKLGRRRQVDKAKQLAEKTNSLKRRKKHEAAKTMAQKLPRDFVKDSVSNGNVSKNASFKGNDILTIELCLSLILM